MAAKKVKPATDSIIGRRVRINDDATYPNGNRHAWAGFTGTVRVHNGRSVYQVEMDDAEVIEVFPLESFMLLADLSTADAADAQTSAADTPATPGTPEPTAPDHGELAMLDIAHIVRSKTNPRKHFDADALAELAASIKLQGVAQPILVRPLPASRVQETAENRLPGDPLPTHELVAGERRYRACKQAGVKAVPALIRHLTDTQVLELQLVENLKRSDLHPMEEAEGYEALMQQAGMTADQIADRIGKSKSYVYKSLKLLDLSPNSRTAFYDGKISASVALLVARHIELHQAEIIKDVTDENYYGDVMSFRAAQEHIQQTYMLRLDKSPFDHDDAALVPAAGACTACPKRTGANPDLFTDVDHADTCTDKACFAAKRDAHLQRQVDEAAARGKELITGKEALAILPSQYQDPKGYTLLDKVDYQRLDGSTLRQAIGLVIEDEVLIANPHTHELVAAIPNAKAKQLLADHAKPSKSTQETAKLKAETAYQLAWRERAALAVTEDVLAEAESRNEDLPAITVMAIRLAAKRLAPASHEKDALKLLCKLIGLDSQIGTHSALMDHIDNVAPVGAEEVLCAILAMDDVDYSPMYKTPHPTLDALAKPLGIDLEAIQTEVKEEIKAEAKNSAKTKAKEAVKAAVKSLAPATDKAAPQADNAKPKRKAKTTPEEAQAAIAQAMQEADANTAGAEA